jgi:hypothetical protein
VTLPADADKLFAAYCQNAAAYRFMVWASQASAAVARCFVELHSRIR